MPILSGPAVVGSPMTARLGPCRPAGDPEPHFPVPREGGLLVSVGISVVIGDSHSGTEGDGGSLDAAARTQCGSQPLGHLALGVRLE